MVAKLKEQKAALIEKLKHHQWLLEECSALHDRLYREFNEIRDEYEALAKELEEAEGKIKKIPMRRSGKPKAKSSSSTKEDNPVKAAEDALKHMSAADRAALLATLSKKE